MNDKDIKEKTVFVVGLFAIFFALTNYKEKLASITGLIGGNIVFTLWQLLEFLIGCLMISIYLYALSYVFGKHINNFLYKVVIFFANFFYAFALIYPLFIVIGSLINTSPFGDFSRHHPIGLAAFDITGTIIIIILSILNAKGKIKFNPLKFDNKSDKE